MKQNEMKVGRWYHNDIINVDYKLDNYTQIGDSGNYSPIPMSGKFLLDNGFELLLETGVSLSYRNRLVEMEVVIHKRKNDCYLFIKGGTPFRANTIDKFQSILEALDFNIYSDLLVVK